MQKPQTYVLSALTSFDSTHIATTLARLNKAVQGGVVVAGVVVVQPRCLIVYLPGVLSFALYSAGDNSFNIAKSRATKWSELCHCLQWFDHA